MKASHTIRPVFDDPNLVSTAGLIATLGLAESAGLHDFLRRVQRLQPLAGDGSRQRELSATYLHHAFITNSLLGLVEADQAYRDHAIV